MTVEGELTLGVIVCCRDEERVIERRLRNLALSQWPLSARPHRVLVVDDGSRDGTASIARSIGASVFRDSVSFDQIENRLSAGKAGAIATGIAELGSSVDLVILTDADVVHDADALTRLTDAFQRDPNLGMACGSQRFVDVLPADGTTQSQGGGSAGGIYDRLTDFVRARESRTGRVFSVHGQLLAWRADLHLNPRPDIAADDLDLMLQVRLAKARVERIAAARFFEIKPIGAWLRRRQGVRRARAYLQFIRGVDPNAAPDKPTRRQWRAYSWVPNCLVPALILLAAFELALLAALLLAASWVNHRVDDELLRIIFWVLPWALILAPVIQLWNITLVVLDARILENERTVDAQWTTTR